MAQLFLLANGPMPTTAALVKVTTGTAIKTMLQVKLGAAVPKAKIVEWGISFDGSAAAVPIQCELIETGTVFGTVTAYVANDIVKLGDPNDIDPTTSLISVGTSASGYTCTSEGTITATRMFDIQMVAPTNQYVKQWPLGREPVLNVGTAGRIRVTAPVAVNCWCYVVLEI